MRIPDLKLLLEPERAPTLAEAVERWRSSRVDVREGTRVFHRVALDRLLPLIGDRRLDGITVEDLNGAVVSLSEKGRKPATIRKSIQTLATLLDDSGIDPNPARGRIRFPYEETIEPEPPTSEHVEAVFRLLAPAYRLPLLWLDWSGARVSSVETLRVGDYDEPARRVRLRAATQKQRRALWSNSPTSSRTRSSRRSRRARTAIPTLSYSPKQERIVSGPRSRAPAEPPRSLLLPARSPSPKDQPPPSAGQDVGADRGVRRPAEALRHVGRLHARPQRRSRDRLCDPSCVSEHPTAEEIRTHPYVQALLRHSPDYPIVVVEHDVALTWDDDSPESDRAVLDQALFTSHPIPEEARIYGYTTYKAGHDQREWWPNLVFLSLADEGGHAQLARLFVPTGKTDSRRGGGPQSSLLERFSSLIWRVRLGRRRTTSGD